MIPKQARPKTFSPEQLRSLKVPVLLVLGERDGLVGNSENAKKLAQNNPDIQAVVLNTSHAIGVERPEEVNLLIYDFFEQP